MSRSTFKHVQNAQILANLCSPQFSLASPSSHLRFLFSWAKAVITWQKFSQLVLQAHWSFFKGVELIEKEFLAQLFKKPSPVWIKLFVFFCLIVQWFHIVRNQFLNKQGTPKSIAFRNLSNHSSAVQDIFLAWGWQVKWLGKPYQWLTIAPSKQQIDCNTEDIKF